MPFNQPLSLDPSAPSWRDATPAQRLAYFKQAGEVARRVKREELARGIGRNGRRMAPRKRPRRDGANGPVLTPHNEESRTSRLLDFRATARSVTLFWNSGIGRAHTRPWGTILGFHAAGEVRGAPVRDVRLSTRGMAKVRAELALYWSNLQRLQTRRANQAVAARQKALTTRHPGLASYFRPKGESF